MARIADIDSVGVNPLMTSPTETNTLLTDCPPISVPSHITINNDTHPALILSSTNRTIGSIIHVTCPEKYHLIGPQYLLCDERGQWNHPEQPYCRAPEMIGMQLLIAILAGCALLVVIAVTVIVVRLVCFRRKKVYSDSKLFVGSSEDRPGEHIENVQVETAPYYVEDKRYRSISMPRSPTLNGKPIHGEITHAVFVNPAYRDHGIDNDRRREVRSAVIPRSEYDTPWEHSIRPLSVNGDHWSTPSMHAVDNLDNNRFGRIPRARALSTPEKVEDGYTSF